MADTSGGNDHLQGQGATQIEVINGTLSNSSPWAVKTEQGSSETTTFYPYEWKVDDKAKSKQHQQARQISGVSTVALSTVDLKHVTQLPIPQTMTQQTTWGGAQATVVATSSPDGGWSTIKWENPSTVMQKPSTINTAGLQFVSATPVQGNITMNVIHGGRKTNPIIETFKCEVCNQIFASIASLQSHISTVHEVGGSSKKKNKFNPSTLHCEYKYSGITLGDAITGGQVIGGVVTGVPLGKDGKPKKEKRRNWQCDICQNRFTRKDHLQKHVSAVHEKIRPFECSQCGQKFSQKHHLRAHVLARHEDDKAFACQQCPKRFTRNDHLERHVESVHEKRKSFECTVCNMQFGRKHHLSKHILAVHAKVKPYGCHLCDQSFLQRHHLGAHLMQAHQPPVHEEPDGTKTYVCAICSHRFKRKDHLKKHVETVHEKTRAYACQLCEKRFGQKYHLAIHVSAVHEGKKPFACQLCTHKSARKSGLQRHLKTVHNIQPHQQQQLLQQQPNQQQQQQQQQQIHLQPQQLQQQSQSLQQQPQTIAITVTPTVAVVNQ